MRNPNIRTFSYKETKAKSPEMQRMRYSQGEEDALAGISHRLHTCPHYHSGWMEGRKQVLININEN